MPKPKRPRPPVVKTDWVVETATANFMIPFDTLEKAKARAAWGWSEESKNKGTVYERK